MIHADLRYRDQLAPGSYLAISHGTTGTTEGDGFEMIEPGAAGPAASPSR